MKETLLDRINSLLLRRGYTVKNLSRGCFDVLARKEASILLMKVLEDVNSISREISDEMRSVASYLDASAVIVAKKAHEPLQDNVVYSRFGICTVNYSTLSKCIENRMPFLKRSKAGLTATISGENFKQKREERGFSLNSLSRTIGVTSRMITKYEKGSQEITINKAIKIYDIFGHDVFNSVDIFSREGIKQKKNTNQSAISQKYHELGFEAADLKKTPFDIIARKNDEIILTEVSDNLNPNMESLSRLIDADNLVIFSKKKPRNIPSMTKREFMNFEKAEDLVKFVKDN